MGISGGRSGAKAVGFVCCAIAQSLAIAQSHPTIQAQRDFSQEPSISTAQALFESCPDVPSLGSVYDRYEKALARRQCLERGQNAVFAAMSVVAPTTAQSVAPALANADQQIADAKRQEAQLWAEKAFLGFNWAVGAGYAFGRGNSRIDDAEVVNGIVRVKEDNTDRPRVVLEIHHLFEGGHDFGWGPFASAQAGTGDSNLGFGLGLEMGWRDKSKDAESSGGFLLGIGYEWDGGAKVLGDGIVANQALPTGETQVRFKKRTLGSLLVFVGRRFDLSGPPKN